MSEEKPTSDEILAANPEIQEVVDMLSGTLEERAFTEWEATQLENPRTPAETPEPVAAPKPAPAPAKPLKQEPKYAVPVAVTVEDIENYVPQAAGPAVVSNNSVDYVRVGSIVFKNVHSRKSLSVHHMQRRLHELGYTEAFGDKDGFYGDRTREALGRFQGDNNLLGGGMADRPTLELLFTGDPNVILVD